jgi:hypothetical protein
MTVKFQDLRDMFVVGICASYSHLPSDPLRDESKLTENMLQLLNISLIKRYMSLVGSIGNVTGTIRISNQYAHLVLSRKLQSPRQ